jgi:hypothetical protein
MLRRGCNPGPDSGPPAQQRMGPARPRCLR